MSDHFSKDTHPDTVAARYAVDSDAAHGAVIPPLYMSSTFSFHGFGEKRTYDYTRSGNPTRDQLAEALAALEGGVGGVITASGMSAVHLVTQLVKPGELIVAPHDCYGGCHRLFSAAARRGLFELQWLPVDNLLINLGLGLLSTEYQDFVIPSGDFSGNDITMSPEVTFTGLIQDDVPLGDSGTVTLQTDFNYQDEVFFDALNNPLLREGDSWLWNARVGWVSADERWEVAAFGRNLGDEEYMVYAFDLSFFGFNEEMIGTPRAFGGEVTYRF